MNKNNLYTEQFGFFESATNRRYRCGSVLILVLVVVASLTALSFGLAYRARIEVRLAYSNAQKTQAYYLALGGIERIKTLLKEEVLAGDEDGLNARIAEHCFFSSTAGEEGIIGGAQNNSSMEMSLSYSLRDEQAYFNTNTSSPLCWIYFNRISGNEQASIVDWLDEDDDVTSSEGELGAEMDFYQSQVPTYETKNGFCVSLRELLFIRGITYEEYAGEDANHDSVLDTNENDAYLSKPSDNSDGTLDLGLIDFFTVYGNGKININTASREVLSALLAGHGEDDSVAETIITFRNTFGEDECFQDSGDFANVPGLTAMQASILEDTCCFSSSTFRIFSYARINNKIDCCLMATVNRADDGKLQVLYLERLI